jgi:hypothetical protein
VELCLFVTKYKRNNGGPVMAGISPLTADPGFPFSTEHRAIDRLWDRRYIRGWAKAAFDFPVLVALIY